MPEVFLIDRDDTSVALGNTIEHRAGWFYVQEVAAAHPPFLLKQHIVQEPQKILDMCAAPGGKTTQLADYFPESLIIANEVNRTRTPQLFDNLDRMGYDNIAVVSCDGRFFQNFPDFFDAVLLDAPCSGEGTAFRDKSIVDHWHEKNIDRIAKLQKQLMETADTIVKPGGVLSYSTCTLNVMENEEVIEHELQKGTLEEKMRKKFWPHIEHTGGFFASIFQKKNSSTTEVSYPQLVSRGQKPVIRPATKGEYELVERFVSKHLHTKLQSGYLYCAKDTLYFSAVNLTNLSEYFYFVHVGRKIGTVKKNTFEPSHHLYWCLEARDDIPSVSLTADMVYKK